MMEEGNSSMSTAEMGEVGKGSRKSSTQSQQQNIPTHLVKMFKVSSNLIIININYSKANLKSIPK